MFKSRHIYRSFRGR